MIDYKKQLDDLESEIGAKTIEKAKLEERKDGMEKELDAVNASLKDMVPDGQDIDEWLEKEEQAIVKGIKECQTILAES